MKTFYDFIAEWEANCDTCVHCGHVGGDCESADYSHEVDGCHEDGYDKEVIEAYIMEEVWNE